MTEGVFVDLRRRGPAPRRSAPLNLRPPNDRGAGPGRARADDVQIGRALFVSEATVKTHLMRACAKLGVTGRTAAVTKAMETGALPPPGGPP